MKKIFYANILLLLVILNFISCTRSVPVEPISLDLAEVIINDIPYKTEMYNRIGYTLKMWEYQKAGFVLNEIIVIDKDAQRIITTIKKDNFPTIYKAPLDKNPYFEMDEIHHYYFSLQLPIPLDQPIPNNIIHQFIFRDTIYNKDFWYEGASFQPRKNEIPVTISSPVKGNNWLFINQSSNDYHFYVLFFLNGKIGTGERYAFDNLKIDNNMKFFSGDPRRNESYYNYKDTLYAVANGTVVQIQDGLPENLGDAHNLTFNSPLELAGNFLILDMGGSKYAFYAHCVPNSFFVKVGDQIKEGDPVALLGNSGNSTAPHLHFQICDSPDFFSSNGLPFVLKKYNKLGDAESGFLSSPILITNSMMEENTIIGFD